MVGLLLAACLVSIGASLRHSLGVSVEYVFRTTARIAQGPDGDWNGAVMGHG